MVILLLVDWGLLAQPLLNLSRFFEDNRQEYYDRWLAVSQRGDWEAWLNFFLTGVAVQAKDADRQIAVLETLRARYRGLFEADSSRLN